MKIAIIGSRGIPVVYSGFETFAEELATRLKKKKHAVSVYCRSNYVEKNKKYYKKVRLIVLPSVKSKSFETFFHSFISTIHAIFQKYDVVYYLGVGSSVFSIIPRLFGTKTIVNVDGLDWRREKWGFVGKTYLSLSELVACLFPNKIITDSKFVTKYYKEKFRKKTTYIPYGYYDEKIAKKKIPTSLKVGKNNYLLWVGRIVPDNHLDELLEAYKKIDTNLKCVVIGGNLIKSEYETRFKKKYKNNKNIIFGGFLKRQEYASVLKNAYSYIETKRSGGTHPSLVEAMGYGKLIVSCDYIANRQVLGGSSLLYKTGSPSSLKNKLEWIIDTKNKRTIERLKRKTKARAKKEYGWDGIIERYEKLFKSVI